VGSIEGFWRRLFGSDINHQWENDENRASTKITSGTLFLHRTYAYADEYTEMQNLQQQWTSAWIEYVNALIGESFDKARELFLLMKNLDNEASELIEQIEGEIVE
jgi:hypothetical protein